MSEFRSFRLAPDPEGSRVWWILFPLFGLFVGLILLFFVLLSPGRVDGDSMEPTLHSEERTLATLGYSQPRLGDVIVFDVRDSSDKRIRLVKRVVGLPGDSVRVEGDAIWVNGSELHAPAIDSGRREPAIGPVTVPEDHVLVMGDNRPVALDSRDFGPVPLYSVHGRVVAVFWPPKHIRVVH